MPKAGHYPARAICPGCGWYFQQKKDGTLRAHKVALGDGSYGWCPQSKTKR